MSVPRREPFGPSTGRVGAERDRRVPELAHLDRDLLDDGLADLHALDNGAEDFGFGDLDVAQTPIGGRRRAHALTAIAAGLAVALALVVHSLAADPAAVPRPAARVSPQLPRAGTSVVPAAPSRAVRMGGHSSPRGRGRRAAHHAATRLPATEVHPAGRAALARVPEAGAARRETAGHVEEFGFER